MCGIFGYLTKRGKGPDLELLREIAIDTERRGNHAFGLAWLDQAGEVHSWKAPGPATQWLKKIGLCRDAQIVVGHCRWATHGSASDNRNNHPHKAGRGYLVHNGIVENYYDLLQQHRIRPESDCDSEIFGLLIHRMAGSIYRRARWACEQTMGSMSILGVWANPGRLLIARDGRPLHFSRTQDGMYLASEPTALPGKVFAVPDGFLDVQTIKETANAR